MVLRDNPFEGLTTDALAPIYEWPEEAVRFLEGHADCLHVTGDCGMGKTTLLQQIECSIRNQGESVTYTCIPLDGAIDLAEACSGTVALLDETDRLDSPALRDLLTALWDGGHKPVVAGHKKQLREIRRAGFAPLYIQLRAAASSKALARIFTQRIDVAAGDPDHPYELTPEATRALLHHCRGNVERCLQIGYEVFEDLDSPRAISATDIATAAADLDQATTPAEA